VLPSVMRPRRLEIPVHGGDLAVSIDGQVSGRAPLLFVHGWALDQRVWAPQIAAFAADRAVVTFDRRGFGRSSAPADPAREADDLAVIIAALGLVSPIMIGMSQGARSVADFVGQRASAIGGAVFHGAPSTGEDPVDGPFSVPLVMVRTLARAGRYDEIARLLTGHPLFQLRGGNGRATLMDILADYRARDADVPLPSDDWSAALRPALAHVPMLFLYGEHDSPARIAVGRRLRDQCENARFAIVDRAGHLANLCAPDVFNAALTAFLTFVDRHRFETVALPTRQ
jgi:pimeloyl-ACP methyl ester carboxylesterase